MEEAERAIAKARASGSAELRLNGLGLRELPGSLARLSTIDTLYLSGNEIAVLPDWFGRLASLRFLFLEDNALTALPESLRGLRQLSFLALTRNELTTLPTWIGDFDSLVALYATQNELNALPDSIGRLTALRALWLSDNQLSDLPASIGRLARLEHLGLWNNRLTALPHSIGGLAELRDLNVGCNTLNALPATLAECRKLGRLDASSNALLGLPPGLDRLPLAELWLHDNPGLGLSDAILGEYVAPAQRTERTAGHHPRSILEAYYSARGQDARPLNEIKLVLVGRGASGKTSIKRALMGKPFRKQRETQGIDIDPWTLRCAEHDVRVNVWDFAGQVITHATHQFFLSESSVYVLVLTGREDTQKIDAEYWLRLIRAFGADREGRVSPVIVALNKFDEHPFKVDRRALQERYPFVVGFVETDCKPGRGVEELRALLGGTIAGMPIIDQRFKREWWDIKQALEQAQKKRNYMPYATFQEICAKHGEPEEERQRFLADVFHALGVALNYGGDARLRDSTVLNPRWVTEGIYRLLHEAVAGDDGVLAMERVRAVLKSEPEPMRRYLVDLMRRFDLAFPLGEDGERWLVPQRLPEEQPELAPHWPIPAGATRLRYQYAVIPEGLLPRFIARTYPLGEAGDDGARRTLPRWRNGVVLADAGARALVRVDADERRVEVTVTGAPEERRELLGVIQDDFRTIHADIKGLDVEERLEIEGHAGTFVPVQTLLADEALRSPSAAPTAQGTLRVEPTAELNRLSAPPARADPSWRPRVFVSYTSDDIRQKDQLLTRLKPLRETHGLLDLWHDGEIRPGEDWDHVVRAGLEDADVVLLLVSAQFLASDYVRGVEVKRSVERARAGDCIVIPIILEKVDWKGEAFGQLNALPRKGKPIRDARPQRDAWHAIAVELKAELGRLVDEHERRERRGGDRALRGARPGARRGYSAPPGVKGHMAF